MSSPSQSRPRSVGHGIRKQQELHTHLSELSLETAVPSLVPKGTFAVRHQTKTDSKLRRMSAKNVLYSSMSIAFPAVEDFFCLLYCCSAVPPKIDSPTTTATSTMSLDMAPLHTTAQLQESRPLRSAQVLATHVHLESTCRVYHFRGGP